MTCDHSEVLTELLAEARREQAESYEGIKAKTGRKEAFHMGGYHAQSGWVYRLERLLAQGSVIADPDDSRWGDILS